MAASVAVEVWRPPVSFRGRADMQRAIRVAAMRCECAPPTSLGRRRLFSLTAAAPCSGMGISVSNGNADSGAATQAEAESTIEVFELTVPRLTLESHDNRIPRRPAFPLTAVVTAEPLRSGRSG